MLHAAARLTFGDLVLAVFGSEEEGKTQSGHS